MEVIETTARHGEHWVPWAELKAALLARMIELLADDSFNGSGPESKSGQEQYAMQCAELQGALERYEAAPFTVQRLCEVLLAPQACYTKRRALVFALYKLLSVVATQEQATGAQPSAGEASASAAAAAAPATPIATPAPSPAAGDVAVAATDAGDAADANADAPGPNDAAAEAPAIPAAGDATTSFAEELAALEAAPWKGDDRGDGGGDVDAGAEDAAGVVATVEEEGGKPAAAALEEEDEEKESPAMEEEAAAEGTVESTAVADAVADADADLDLL